MLTGTDSPSSSRALVALATPTHKHAHRPIQRVASFLTQLLANAGRLPQARQKRRADAAEVIAAYQATADRLQKLSENPRKAA